MRTLEGKVALVTGGTSGIGLATAKRFVTKGAYVFITGRRDPELAAAVKEIGRDVTGVQGDVSRVGDLDRLFAQIKREKGTLDIVFANAGVAQYAPFGKITEEHFDSIFNTNVKGLLFTVQKALPLMPDGASIILNASIVGSKGFPANSVYSATKAAVRSFARTWTTELKDRRIRVNAVSPGPIDTPGLNELLASSETGQQRAKMIATTVPLRRLGRPDEIAKAVTFLASDDSGYITGIELFVDGGVAQGADQALLNRVRDPAEASLIVASFEDMDPCLLSCRSRSVLANPLESQWSRATISPGCGTNSLRISPPHVPYSKVLLSQAAFWTGAMCFQVS